MARVGDGAAREDGRALGLDDVALDPRTARLQRRGDAGVRAAGADDVAERVDPALGLRPQLGPGVALVGQRLARRVNWSARNAPRVGSVPGRGPRPGPGPRRSPAPAASRALAGRAHLGAEGLHHPRALPVLPSTSPRRTDGRARRRRSPAPSRCCRWSAPPLAGRARAPRSRAPRRRSRGRSGPCGRSRGSVVELGDDPPRSPRVSRASSIEGVAPMTSTIDGATAPAGRAWSLMRSI